MYNSRSGRAWERGYRQRTYSYASLVPGPNAVVCGLGTRLRVRMRTKLENGVLRNGAAAAVCLAVEVMKTLSVRGPARYDKRQSKTTVST